MACLGRLTVLRSRSVRPDQDGHNGPRASAARCLRAARDKVPTGPTQQDAAWMFAKEEMSWSGSEAIRPTPRLAWMLLTGLASEIVQAAARRRGVYDTRVVGSTAG